MKIMYDNIKTVKRTRHQDTTPKDLLTDTKTRHEKDKEP